MALELRALADADVTELRRIHTHPDVAFWWDEPPADFPRDDPDATRLTIVADGTVVGLIQYCEELEPKYRSANIDIFLDPAVRGRGTGTEAVRRVLALLLDERGHHRVTIDPALANVAAIRAYEKAGFTRVGVLRQAERDADGQGWHDALLMEHVAGDPR